MDYLISVMPQILQGAEITLKLFGFTLLGSIPLGLVLSFVAASKMPVLLPFRIVIQIYVWLMRGTPLLLQLIFIFYGLPLWGIVFDRFEAAVFAFVINYAAYFVEIFRGGVQAIPKGQYEAGQVLRLSKLQTIQHIIVPQVVKITFPSVGNEVVNLVKDTSLVYILGLSDMMRIGKIAMERDTSLVPLVGVGIVYLAMIGFLTLLMKYVEKKMAYYR